MSTSSRSCELQITSYLERIGKIVLLTTCILCCAAFASAQGSKEMSTIELVKILNGHRTEALFFYQNNWQVFREKAVEKKIIASFELFLTKADTSRGFDLMLVTTYADSIQFAASEERFQQIIRELRPKGASLLNEFKPADFRKSLGVHYANKVAKPKEK
jgi:hypothetical protein